MTTTELIKLLQEHERGGATGASRKVSFAIKRKKITYVDEPEIEFYSCGDGMICELCLLLTVNE